MVGLIFNSFIYASDKLAQAIIQKDKKKKHKVKNEEGKKKALKAQKWHLLRMSCNWKWNLFNNLEKISYILQKTMKCCHEKLCFFMLASLA